MWKTSGTFRSRLRNSFFMNKLCGDGRSRGVRSTGGEPDVSRRCRVAVARITEVITSSTESFEDAIRQGVDRASRTLRG